MASKTRQNIDNINNIIANSAIDVIPNKTNKLSMADAYDYLKILADITYGKNKIIFPAGTSSGKAGYTPGTIYPYVFVRDFAMSVRARPEFFKASDLMTAIDLFFSVQNATTYAIYDAVSTDGITAIGPGTTNAPSYDNIFELVDLIYSHHLLTGLPTAYNTYKTKITNALSYVPILNHLVYISNTAPITCGWGFQDSEAMSGYSASCSVFRYRSLRQLAEMESNPTNSAAYTSEANLMPSNLQTYLWDASYGLFHEATINNSTQHTVPISALACTLSGLVSDSIKSIIIQKLIDGRPNHVDDLAGKGFYQDGQIRHMPFNENWTSFQPWGGLTSNGIYQNGGYWSTFTGWVANAIEMKDPIEANKLVAELVQKFRTDPQSQIPIEASNKTIPWVGSTIYCASMLVLEYFNNKLFNRDLKVQSDELPIAPTLLNSWVNFGTPLMNVGYWKDRFGYVNCRGTIKSGSISTIAFVLPVGYRPSGNISFTVLSNNAFGAVAVASDGSVSIVAGSNLNLGLDSIRFRVDV